MNSTTLLLDSWWGVTGLTEGVKEVVLCDFQGRPWKVRQLLIASGDTCTQSTELSHKKSDDSEVARL